MKVKTNDPKLKKVFTQLLGRTICYIFQEPLPIWIYYLLVLVNIIHFYSYNNLNSNDDTNQFLNYINKAKVQFQLEKLNTTTQKVKAKEKCTNSESKNQD